MRKFKFRVPVAGLLFLMMGICTLGFASEKNLTIMFSGDMKGYIEPCG